MRWRRRNEDLDRELEAHLELEAEEQADSGLTSDEARYAARRTFGNVTSVKEDVREEWGWPQRLDAIARDTRFALRTFRRRTGAYVFAIVVLGVGIGMTTALFSLVQAVLLQPLPFPEQDALRIVSKALPGSPYAVELAYAELEDLTEGIDVFESVAVLPTTAYANGRVVQAAGLEPVDVDTAPVSPDFFRTLGAKPMLGQDFPASGDGADRGPLVVLSHDLWRGYFGSDRSVIGQQISIDGRGHEVIGVMGPGIDFPRRAKLWLLLSDSGRGGQWLQAIARVAPGNSDERVNAEVRGLFQRQAEEYPQFYPATQEPVIERLTDYWTGSTRLQLWVSLGSSFLLLLAACITAGNLFLSRALARRQEIATRTSLGATGRQVLSQFAVEGLAAGVLAGSLGLAIAWALIQMLIAWSPAEIPRIAEASLSPAVLWFAAAASLLTSLACSIAPTWLASRVNAATLLREGDGRLTGGRSRRAIQAAFTVGQTAVTVVLLAASLLTAVSLHAMLSEDIGFENQTAVTMHLHPRGPQFTPEDQDEFYRRLLDRLRQSPMVTSAGAVLLRPLEGPIGWEAGYRLDGDAVMPEEEVPSANFQVVTPNYFETVGTTLLEGRDFDDRDDQDGPQSLVISRSLADRLRKAGREPLGSRIHLEYGRKRWWTVVGIVTNARYRGIQRTNDDLYVNYLQVPVPVRYPVVRGSGTTAELAALVQSEAAQLDSRVAVGEVATIGQLVERDTGLQRFNMTLLLLFAAGAILLAAAGIYSVVTETLTEQRREIVIRMALGADRGRLVSKLVAATSVFVIVGGLVGLGCVLLLGRSVADLLYAVAPDDPVILGAVVVFVLLVSVFAALIPAWTVTGQEPRSVLQAD